MKRLEKNICYTCLIERATNEDCFTLRSIGLFHLNIFLGGNDIAWLLLSAFAPLIERHQNYECLRENENLTLFKEKID